MNISVKTLIITIVNFMLLSACSNGSSENEYILMTPEVQTVTLMKICPSEIEASRMEELIARVNGEVLGVYASPGAKVTEGQLIYYIDDTPYLDAVHQAHVALSTATAEYENSLELYQAAQRKAAAGESTAEAVRQAKEAMDKNLSRMENARSALAKAEEMLSYCRIRAPFSGTLSRDTVTQYSYIGGETDPLRLGTVINDDTLSARISMSIADLEEVENFRQKNSISADSVMMQLADLPGKTHFAIIGNTVTANDSVTITLLIDNSFRELKNGMKFNALLPYGIANDAIIVKNSALVNDDNGSAIFTVNDDNKVVRIPVKPGAIHNDSLRIIESGLSKSTLYIVYPAPGITDGQKVKVRKP